MLASRWPVIEMRHLREGVEGEGGERRSLRMLMEFESLCAVKWRKSGGAVKCGGIGMEGGGNIDGAGNGTVALINAAGI